MGKAEPNHTLVPFLVAGLLMLAPYASLASDKTQHISFAISGGASKGAYEAGINWALLTLLHSLNHDDTPVLQGQYRPFQLASIAGASAGGINTLLSGMVWCLRAESEGGYANNIQDNIFRHVWLLPDINSLLPQSATSPAYRHDDAILSRKGLLEASNYLKQKWREPAYRKGCRIPLGVTVTRVEPEVMQIGGIKVKNQRFTIPFEIQVQADQTLAFRFDPADYTALHDYSMILLPRARDAPPFSIDGERIEEVVLTSSALPLAFGRKRLHYCRRHADYDEKHKSATLADGNEHLRCPATYELSTAEFADGGLFDNLPIGLARTLAEKNLRNRKNALPSTYIYIDPDRIRYPIPQATKFAACNGDQPPAACEQMEYGLISESNLLFGALSTARNDELYRELTGDSWAYNLSELSYKLATKLQRKQADVRCDRIFPHFKAPLECAQALRYTGQLLETSYDRYETPITAPFSVRKLRRNGFVDHCRQTPNNTKVALNALCTINIAALRRYLSRGLLKIIGRYFPDDPSLGKAVRRASLSIKNDRIIRVTSRGAPITATLLNSFGAFLDLNFREYDYYVGIYDAIVSSTQLICRRHYSPQRQAEAFLRCRDELGQRFYNKLGLPDDPRGRYVFALLANWEFKTSASFRFATLDVLPHDKNMRIIHEALNKTLATEQQRAAGLLRTSVEFEFFEYLKEHGFSPAASTDKRVPLLAEIMNDPDLWSYELTRRFTNRLSELEQTSQRIISEREPDPAKRAESYSTLLGGSAFILRSMTYKHQPFEFAPSTAPRDWIWRNIIPYELGYDVIEGDLLFTWQPTWSLSRHNTLALRGSVALAQGIFGSNSQTNRDDYFAIGLDYTRLTPPGFITSWGMTPSYFRTFKQQSSGKRDAIGGDVHLGLLQNKLRLSVGMRDLGNSRDSWYLMLGVTDIPGLVHWLSR